MEYKIITEKRVAICFDRAKKEEEKIPFSHCRKRDKKYHETIISELQSATEKSKAKPTEIVGKTLTVYSTENYNLGTKKWSDYIKIYAKDTGKIERETPKTIYVRYSSGYVAAINKGKIIAIAK